MNVYAIGLSWDKSIKTKQPLVIRLIDLDDNNKTIDVTRKQLVQVMKSNKIKINNLELSKYSRLKGVDYSINLIPDLDKESDRYSALVLNNINGVYTLANYLGQIIKTTSLNTIELRNIRITNIQVNKNKDNNSDIDIVKIEKTTKQQQNKYKLLLEGSKYTYLLKEPYIDNIEFMFKLAKELDLGTNKKLKLNTEKYFNFDNNELDKLKLANSFISISNLITTIYKNDKTFFQKDFDTKFDCMDLYNTIYQDDDCKIYIVEYIYIEDKDTSSNIHSLKLNNTAIKAIQIIINNKKVFETAYITNGISNFLAGSFYKLYNLNKIKQPRERSIAKYVQKGDKIHIKGYMKLQLFEENRLQIPIEINEEIGKTVVESWVALAEIKNEKTRNILMFDIVEQLLIELDFINSSCLSIKRILGLERIEELNKKYIEQLTLAYKDKHVLNIIEYKTMSDSKREELLNNRNNYDLDGNKNISELANMVYKEIEDIGGKDKITKNITGLFKASTMNKILETDFFSKKTLKSSERLIRFYKNNKKEVYKLSDSDKEITEIEVDMPNDIWSKTSIIINSETNKSYICDKKLKTIVCILYILGYNLNNKVEEDKPLNKITNENINIQNFLICDTLINKQLCDRGFKVHTAFDRYNCDVYIISEWYDTDFKTILRFKRYKDAKDYVFNNIKKYWIYEDFNTFYTYNQNLTEYTTEALACIVARNSIMQGIPNNFPYIYTNVDFFDKLAKQPKN